MRSTLIYDGADMLHLGLAAALAMAPLSGSGEKALTQEELQT